MTSFPKVEVVTVTPDMAKEWMKKNVGNRPLRKPRVSLYADFIRNNQWKFTGDPIVFSNGNLIQGQHRLAACIHADVPFTTAVVFDADPSCYEVMDSGIGRKPGDVLSHYGHANASMAAAAAKLVIGYRTSSLHDSYALMRVASRQAIANEVNAFADLYGEACTRGKTISQLTRVNGSALAAFEVLLVKAGSFDPDWFDRLRLGANLEPGDPILALRNWAIGARRYLSHVHLSVIIRSWNAYIRGERRTIVKAWFPGSPYPVIEVPDARDVFSGAIRRRA